MCAVEKVATELKPSLSKNHLLISIAAGVTLPVCTQRKKLLGLTKSCMVHEV
jgi:pyrroline-5-carboxylate reductase